VVVQSLGQLHGAVVLGWVRSHGCDLTRYFQIRRSDIEKYIGPTNLEIIPRPPVERLKYQSERKIMKKLFFMLTLVALVFATSGVALASDTNITNTSNSVNNNANSNANASANNNVINIGSDTAEGSAAAASNSKAVATDAKTVKVESVKVVLASANNNSNANANADANNNVINIGSGSAKGSASATANATAISGSSEQGVSLKKTSTNSNSNSNANANSNVISVATTKATPVKSTGTLPKTGADVLASLAISGLGTAGYILARAKASSQFGYLLNF